METKTFGTITTKENMWIIEAEPQVVIKLKRIFPKIVQHRAKQLQLSHTPENGLELDWFLIRYPMKLDKETETTIKTNKQTYQKAAEATLQILSGETVITPIRETLRKPRPYQTQAANLAAINKRLLLTDDIGLGKTQSSLLLLQKEGTLPALIVCPANLTEQWQQEIKTIYGNQLETHILQKTKPYNIIKEENKQRKKTAKKQDTTYTPLQKNPEIIISSYNKIWGWKEHFAGNIKTVIYDEIQELRRLESLKHQAASIISQTTEYSIGCTATPISNSGGEVHHLVSALSGGDKLNPLGTKAEFSREWARSDLNGKIMLSDPAALSTHMKNMGILLRREKNEVGLPLDQPLKTVIPVDIDLDMLHKHSLSAVELAEKIVSDATTPQERWNAGGQFELALRMATGVSKAPAAASFVDMLLQNSEENLVVFAYHRGVYDILGERLSKYNPVLYTGSENARQKQENLQKFLDGESKVMMISLKSSAGLDGLQYKTSCGVMVELPFTNLDIIQSCGRILRHGQENVVSWHTLVSDAGTDPVMQNILGIKKAEAMKFDNDSFQPLHESREMAQARIKMIAESFLEQQKR